MDIRDYARMLKRGWPVVLLGALAFVALAFVYLSLTPKQYQATAVLLVSTNEPASIGDLHQGAQFSLNAVDTYAQIIDSSTVLGPVAMALRPQVGVDELVSMVPSTTGIGSTLMNVTVTGHDPALVADIANKASASAARVIPPWQGTLDGQPLGRLQTIRPAVEQEQAVGPNAKRILVLRFIVGAVIGLAAAIAFQALDTRIRRVHDLQVLTEVALPPVGPRGRRAAHSGLVVRDDPTGGFGAAFRTLRTNVRFLDAGARKNLVFTSVADQAGGAQVPSNLAWMLAAAGRRVLLVDLDLRRSAVADPLGIAGGTRMSDELAGRVRLTKPIKDSDHPNLHLVVSGETPCNPSELLSIPKMGSLLAWMESHNEYVILHAAHLLSYSDAAVISGVGGGVTPRQPPAPGTIVTVTAGRTRAQESTTALTVTGNVGVSPSGLVLTRVGRSAIDNRKTGASTRSTSRWRRPTSHRFNWERRRGKMAPSDSRPVG